jgi:nitrite reductase (NADH) small subunit
MRAFDVDELKPESGWTTVCAFHDLLAERGVTALVGGQPVAVFCTYDGALHALHNVDPFSGASVLSKGIMGDRDGVPTVASPVYKQVFDLCTGQCLDDPDVTVPIYPVRQNRGMIEIGQLDEAEVPVGHAEAG